MNYKIALIAFSLSIISCAAPIKHDPTAFNVDTGPKETIPNICKAAYAPCDFKVAVVNFTNNTTFEFAKMVESSVRGAVDKTKTGGAVAGAVPGAAGIVWGEKEKTNFQKDAQTTERQINAKLSESVEDGVTDEIVNMGGATVYTRKDLEKVLSEQKFQQSGLTDDTTLTQIGKLAGVKYIVTGSVNNVDLSYKLFESARKGLDKGGSGSYLGDLMGSVMAAGFEAQEGWNISTDVALRIIDVETGGILFSKIVTGKHVIGKIPYPNYDALIGGMKKAASKGILDIRPQLSKWLAVKGYVVQTRTSPDGKQRSVLVNIGEKQGLKAGSELLVYTFQEITDPFDEKKVSCDIVKLPVELKVTEQLQSDKAWAIIQGKPEQIHRVKTGQLVERKPLEGQRVIKIGY
jgi:curli biogenesis system outer membrane secretion channel CsgG